MRQCGVCGKQFSDDQTGSIFVEAGEWLAEEVWRDAGELCPQCLENRAMLSMMYLNEFNT